LPSDAIVASLNDEVLRLLVEEILLRNPRLAARRAAARAAEERAPQVRALPDPMAGLTLFLLTPETRVGPQEAGVALSQKFPWFGKLRLKEQASLYAAAAARFRVEAIRLDLITEARRLYFELAFLDQQERIVGEDRATLEHYEQLARARYASGVGIGQAVIKIQAEITRADTRLLEIATRRAAVGAVVNALRDRPEHTPVHVEPLATPPEVSLDVESLRTQALIGRPEIAEADAGIMRAERLIELAKKGYRPDVTVGLNYTLVGNREDAAGRANPPQGNGDDILGITGAVNLPIWREKLAAGVEEAVQSRLSADEGRRSVIASIEGSLGDLASRIPLTWDQLYLYDDVLTAQAEQSLLSAEAAYAAGNLNSLDLLDAERVLLNVRISAERLRADYGIALARLEGTVAGPLVGATQEGEQQ
jgi:outer membrane protein TolC